MRRLIAAITIALLPCVASATEPATEEKAPTKQEERAKKEQVSLKERAFDRIARTFGMSASSFVDRHAETDMYVPIPDERWMGQYEDYGRETRSRISRRLFTRAGGDALVAAIPGLEARIQKLDAIKEQMLDKYATLHYATASSKTSLGAAVRLDSDPLGIVVRTRFARQRAYLEFFQDEVTLNYEVPLFGEKLLVSAGDRDGIRSYSIRWRMSR